jgi:hypothetical protein
VIVIFLDGINRAAPECPDPAAECSSKGLTEEVHGGRMSDWLSDVIGDDLIAVYEGLFFTEDAVTWLREKPRTFGELRAEEIDWLRWMAANIDDQDLLRKLSQDPDSDVRMWVACNPMTPKPVLGILAEDPVVFVRRGVAQNTSTPVPLLIRLHDDTDVVVRVLASRKRGKPTPLFSK